MYRAPCSVHVDRATEHMVGCGQRTTTCTGVELPSDSPHCCSNYMQLKSATHEGVCDMLRVATLVRHKIKIY